MDITLYIKTHNKTGLKYFGKTSQNPFEYNGSGKYWKLHINKHGNDITTKIYGRYTQNDPNLKKDAIMFSLTNNIIASKEWANLKIENGLDGGNTFINKTQEEMIIIGNKISERHKGSPGHNLGKKFPVHSLRMQGEGNPNYGGLSEAHKQNISKGKMGHIVTEETRQKIRENSPDRSGENNAMYGKKHSTKSREKMSKNYGGGIVKGHKYSEVICDVCGKIGSGGWMTRFHFENCGKTQERIKCPHCEKVGIVANMKRWHFNNCKFNDSFWEEW